MRFGMTASSWHSFGTQMGQGSSTQSRPSARDQDALAVAAVGASRRGRDGSWVVASERGPEDLDDASGVAQRGVPVNDSHAGPAEDLVAAGDLVVADWVEEVASQVPRDRWPNLIQSEK